MAQARESLISLDATPYYHCVSRCVRRAFLCGEDTVTGENFEHRRAWVENRLLELTQSFSLEVCAYALMHNHSHVVLYVDQEQAQSWSAREVMERWHQLFAGIPLSQRYLIGDSLYPAEEDALWKQVEIWRERLTSVSWFMRCLNEHIARMANAEDGCTGRFWEGRFKSQAILDEAALAACLAYVDLNPVRAGIAETPETSDFTSIKRRIQTLHAAADNPKDSENNRQPPTLFPFVGNPRQDMPKGLPFRLKDYLELLDWTGRVVRDDKRGAIPQKAPPILQRLRIQPESWIKLATRFEGNFPSMAGREEAMQSASRHFGKCWSKGTGNCRVLFAPPT